MNKEDILTRSRHEKKDEIYEYIDNKSLTILSILFVMICLFMLGFSFFSIIQRKIIYTTLSMLFSSGSIYYFAKYYYMKSKIYVIVGVICTLLATYSIVKIWMIMWVGG